MEHQRGEAEKTHRVVTGQTGPTPGADLLSRENSSRILTKVKKILLVCDYRKSLCGFLIVFGVFTLVLLHFCVTLVLLHLCVTLVLLHFCFMFVLLHFFSPEAHFGYTTIIQENDAVIRVSSTLNALW